MKDVRLDASYIIFITGVHLRVNKHFLIYIFQYLYTVEIRPVDAVGPYIYFCHMHDFCVIFNEAKLIFKLF